MLKNRIVLSVTALSVMLGIVGGAMAQDTTVVRLWLGSSSPVENEFVEARVAAFEEANPTIDVDLLISPDYGTAIQNAFASGDYPEVFTVGQFEFPAYVDSGVLADGTGKIEDPEGIYPSLLNAFTKDGVSYCAPKDYSTLALYYNKAQFDAAGLEYPTSEWTWDDLRAAAEALTGEETVGFSAADDPNRWLALFYANGGSLFDAEGNVVFNSAEGVAALDFYASLVKDGFAKTPSALDTGWNGEAFGTGKAAMTIEGNWALGYLDETYPETMYGVAEIPTAPSGNKGTLTFTVCLAVSAAAEGAVADAAWLLANFMTNEAGQQAVSDAGFGVMPARPAVADAWLEAKGDNGTPFITGAEYAVAPVWPLGFGDFNDVIAKGSGSVLDGSVSAQELLDEAAEVAAEIAAEMQ
jgi:multiple sugar transport system substrate-binding protein